MDDPYTFGAICAANSVSDIYAMGGTPMNALAILGYDSCNFGPEVIKLVLRGAVDKLREAGACLIGGHSIQDKEFKLGFSVTGTVERNSILTAGRASAGDMLVLTKPLGTGILTSAVKLGKMRKAGLQDVIASMLQLNKTPSRAAVRAGARTATDVTGFGLLGHALNIAKESEVDMRISFRDVPLMHRMLHFISAGVIPKGARRNLDFCSADVRFDKGLSNAERLALADPQTSGGLLIALPRKGRKKYDGIMKRANAPYWIIGDVIEGKGCISIL